MARRSTCRRILYAAVLLAAVFYACLRFVFFPNVSFPEIDRLHSDKVDFDPSFGHEFQRPSTSPPPPQDVSADQDQEDLQLSPVYHQNDSAGAPSKVERIRARYLDDAEEFPFSLDDLEHLSDPFDDEDGPRQIPVDYMIRRRANERRVPLEIGCQRREIAQAERSNSNHAKIRRLKDLLIRARVCETLLRVQTDVPFIRELRSMMKELQRAVGERTNDSELANDVDKKLRAMEETLAKGKQIQYDCSAVVMKLLAMINSAEREIRAHRGLTTYLSQLTAKTIPKSLHCLPLLLTNEYFSKFSSEQQLPNINLERTNDPNLYHYALFSDNILATAVVVNSTVSNAKIPEQHVFHIVTDKWHYAAMKMWFIANPPGKAYVHVQNIEDFTWLNASYSPVLKQLHSKSMNKKNFKNYGSKSKHRNPKYLSILNHLRFYLPEVLPELDKVVFLDDDVVVQKDLTELWNVDMKGKVNGAVETCGTEFHRFGMYLNFSNPIIAENFDPQACGWAFGMNVFDLAEWRKQKITEIYHYWQNKNADRQLWRLGSLPPGLLTFYNRTFPLDHSWHVLGLGYNPNVDRETIKRAAVIHYNGNFKPWLDVGFPGYRSYWLKYVNYDHTLLQDCKITS